MSAPISRRQWLVSTGLAAGSSVLLPNALPALGAARALSEGGGSYGDALLQLEADVTAARRAAGPIRLCYNENPFGMSPKAKAAISAAWHEHAQYSVPSRRALRETFAKHVGVDPSQVLVTQGSSEVLAVIALAYGLHGAEMVSAWPTFEDLPRYGDTINATVHRVPLTADLGHDFAAMDARITNGVRLVYVCNPNNPTGNLAANGTLRDFVHSTSKRSMVVVDEAYHDFVDDPSYKTLIDMVQQGENLIVSRTASKIHGLAGLRVGFAIARPDIIARLSEFTTGSPNAFGLNAAIASLQDSEYQAFVRQRNREGRELLTSTLTKLGKRVVPSQANFVFFQTGQPVERVQQAMLTKGFLIGRAFPPYTEWARVSIGTPEEMQRFTAALPEALRV